MGYKIDLFRVFSSVSVVFQKVSEEFKRVDSGGSMNIPWGYEEGSRAFQAVSSSFRRVSCYKEISKGQIGFSEMFCMGMGSLRKILVGFRKVLGGFQ